MAIDLIVSLFSAYTTAREVSQLYGSVSDWVVEKVNTWSRKASATTIEKTAEKLGTTTEAEIRATADKAFGSAEMAITPQQREELIGVLINMTRNVRARNSYGQLRSSFLRSERLLDQLLGEVEPVRRWGEPVTAGHAWVLQKFLGMGSFGEVWMARNPDFPTPRAYKFFTKAGSEDWIRREQKNLVQISRTVGEHDNVVAFEDVQVGGCDYPYLAFEYMAGGSLEEWILEDHARRPALKKLDVIRSIVEGLDAAHAQNIAHRDLKPANILIGEKPDFEVKIGDFGLAKVASPAREGPSAQGSLGMVVGTGMYLPPEAQHRAVRRSPFQDDVFAVGVIWYQLLTEAIERPPYDFAERLKVSGVAGPTIRLIELCLAHPTRRFVNAVTLKYAIEKLGDDFPEIAPPPPGKPDVQHLVRDYLLSMAR